MTDRPEPSPSLPEKPIPPPVDDSWIIMEFLEDVGKPAHRKRREPSPSLLLGLLVFAILSVLIGLALAWSVSRG